MRVGKCLALNSPITCRVHTLDVAGLAAKLGGSMVVSLYLRNRTGFRQMVVSGALCIWLAWRCTG